MNVGGVLPNLQATILCYCSTNNRGALSAATFLDMGYKNACYITGGSQACRKVQDAEKST